MLMRALPMLVCLMAVCVAAGCNAVYVSEAVGPAAKPLEESEWKGVLVVQGEFSGQLFVGDAQKGEILLTGAEKDNGGLKLVTWKLYLRPAGDGDQWFVTAENEDENTSPAQKLSFVGLLRMPEEKEKYAILWPANPERFVETIDAGKMPGRSHDKDAYLGKLNQEQHDMITSPSAMLLSWDKPIVLEIVPAMD